MGMFKDMKEGFGVIRSDELKELKKKADAQPKRSMKDSLKLANQAVDQAQAMQQEMGDMMNPGAAGALYNSGLQGMATVNALNDTGTFINNSPVLEMDLTVQVDGRDPYPVKHRQIVSAAALNNFQPGKTFSVRVDQQDPSKLIIG
jgi:hypothetical protein